MRSEAAAVKGRAVSARAGPRFALLAGFAAVAAASASLALRQLGDPGIYYDEVIQAVPAADFLADRAPAPIPGRTQTRLWGRWFPVMTQPYMGALKSQLLIPSFAAFGATPAALRVTTWLWTLAGVGFAMLLARELWGTPAAILAGALLALDPSVLFVGRHDWGSFALAFLLRSAGLWLAVSGWRRGSSARLALAGLAFGLGLYNKVDFGVFLAGAAVAWALAAPRTLWAAVRAPRRLGAGLAGFALGAAPMLAALPGALAAGQAFAGHEGAAPDWGEKWAALFATLDGSYFQRLILAGGRFDALASVQGSARSPFPLLLAASWLFLCGRLARAPGRPERSLVVGLVALGLAGYALTPHAERVHHALALAPFAQFAVAAALADVWRLGGGRLASRAAAAGLAALALAGSARVDLHTLATLEETGGRGRWSDALGRFAAGLDPGTAVVALDWGFAEPLRFLAPEVPVLEPIWELRRRPSLALEGDGSSLYLVQSPEWAVFDHGGRFLEALAALPPEALEIRALPDRAGRTAFLAVRIARPHRLDYRGSFVVRLR